MLTEGGGHLAMRDDACVWVRGMAMGPMVDASVHVVGAVHPPRSGCRTVHVPACHRGKGGEEGLREK